MHVLCALFLCFFSLVWAQQFSSASSPVFNYTGLGVSQPCLKALNTDISCPLLLSVAFQENDLLNPSQLQSLCQTSCLSSLQTARSTVAAACTGPTDYYDDGTTIWPATYFADTMLYAYNTSCVVDPASNIFCDTLIGSWLQNGGLNASQQCSYCSLRLQQLQLDSEFGNYNLAAASSFSASVANCSTTGFAVTAPSPYAVSASQTTALSAPATASATPSSAPSCTKTYTVSSDDTCDSIAGSFNISTISLILANNLGLNCMLLTANQSLCIPPPCNTYRVQGNDTCSSILQKNAPDVSVAQFLTWNPNINLLCGNLPDFINTYLCLSPPGGTLPSAVVAASSNLAPTTPLSAVPRPTNSFGNSTSRCGEWYTIQPEDTCQDIEESFALTLEDILFLNPEINSNCTNLDLGVAYCVKAVGTISTYSGYPTPTTTPYFTLTSGTYTTSSAYTWSNYGVAVSIVSTTSYALASGSFSNCSAYQNYIDLPQSPSDNSFYGSILGAGLTWASFANTCGYVASLYGATLDQFLSWNPSIKVSNSSECYLPANQSFCASYDVTPPVDSLCMQGVGPIPKGTADDCDCFTQVSALDYGLENCTDLATDSGITVAEVVEWNPWVGTITNCNLFANLTPHTENSTVVCIGVNATAPTATATLPPGSASVPPATGTASPSAAPTQSGVAAGCSEYYVVQSGDTCTEVEGEFDLSFSQFYDWNPPIGSTCTNMWVGYAYCVEGGPESPPATTTTSTSPTGSAIPPPAPTQSGTTSDCFAWYVVQSGDGCSKIETEYDVTRAQLYAWNPAIGSTCNNLWIGYAECVDGPST